MKFKVFLAIAAIAAVVLLFKIERGVEALRPPEYQYLVVDGSLPPDDARYVYFWNVSSRYHFEGAKWESSTNRSLSQLVDHLRGKDYAPLLVGPKSQLIFRRVMQGYRQFVSVSVDSQSRADWEAYIKQISESPAKKP